MFDFYTTHVVRDSFDVELIANDNNYVDIIEPYLIDANGLKIPLLWEVFTRNDRVVQIQVPNPSSFGTALVAERFFVDVSGRVRIPESLLSRAGEQLTLYFSASDKGINTKISDGIPVELLGDTEKPVIDIISPKTTLYDRQYTELEMVITDNHRVGAYKVSVIDTSPTVMLDVNGLDNNTIKVNVYDFIDLNQYAPLPAEGIELTLVVEAEDQTGNKSVERRTIKVLPDQPPVVTLVSSLPEDQYIRGQLGFQTLSVSDDYYGVNQDNVHLTGDNYSLLNMYSSLSGLGASRLVTVAHNMGSEVNDRNVPTFIIDYPESSSANVKLMFDGRTYADLSSGQIKLTETFTVDNLQIVIPNENIGYRVVSYSKDICLAAPIDDVYTSADLVANGGQLDIQSYVTNQSVTRLTITPIYSSGQASPLIQQVDIELGNLPNIFSYEDKGLSKNVGAYSFVTLTVRDDNAAQGRAFVHASPARHYGKDYEPHIFIPTLADSAFSSFSLFAHATDRFSSQRAPITLPPLATYQFTIDGEDPAVAIDSPVEGSVTVAGQIIKVDLTSTDNTQEVRRLQLSDDTGVVAELGGVFSDNYPRDDYTFYYQVPSAWAGGDLNLAVISEDASGRSTLQSIVLPVDANQAPLLDLIGFSSYKVNGVYHKILSTPDRLNYGEFWVRIGEDFKLDTRLSDDTGLARYAIVKHNRDGSTTLEFEKLYSTSCPSLPTRLETVGHEITFNESEPTEYEVILEDNVGNISRRSFLVHPLTNVTPEIRIITPNQDQYIVQGTFLIKVEIAATDDRILYAGDVELFANGVKLNIARDEGPIEGANILSAYLDMYSALEQKYSVAIADDYGSQNSPYAIDNTYYFEMPPALIGFNETIKLSARISDSEGAMGTIVIASDYFFSSSLLRRILNSPL
ncbi:MAG: hypothetical protein V3T17_12830 [Pseudomonadales bacterium]